MLSKHIHTQNIFEIFFPLMIYTRYIQLNELEQKILLNNYLSLIHNICI